MRPATREKLWNGNESHLGAGPRKKRVDPRENRRPVDCGCDVGVMQYVMQQSDAAGLYLGGKLLSGPFRRANLPIPDNDIPGDNLVTKRSGIEPRSKTLQPTWRPEQLLSVWRQCRFTRQNLMTPRGTRQAREARMVKAVICNGMAGSCDPVNQIGMSARVLTQHEECCLRAVPIKDLKKSRRGRGVGAIVEGERRYRLRRFDMGDRSCKATPRCPQHPAKNTSRQ